MRNLVIGAIMSFGVCAGLPAHAEIVKTATLDCQGICLHWWPALAVPEGWKQDIDFSNKNNINFLYPVDGPGNTGIYAGAIGVSGQADTLEGFMADDRAGFTQRNPDMVVASGPEMITQDGQVLKSLTFNPAGNTAGKGNWDITAYGEETDPDGNRYYLTFSLSAPSEALQARFMPVFQQVVGAYHK